MHTTPGPLDANPQKSRNHRFTGRGSHIYNFVAPLLTWPLHQQVVRDVKSGRASGRLLDIGTGPGQLALLLARQLPNWTVGGQDVSADMIALARRNAERAGVRVHFEVGDVQALPYADHSFDLIVSTLSLHHWPTLARPLDELHRVLRPGGQAWIYDFAAVAGPRVSQAMAHSPFNNQPIEQNAVVRVSSTQAVFTRFSLRRV